MTQLARITDAEAKAEWEPVLGSDVVPIKDSETETLVGWYRVDPARLSDVQQVAIAEHLAAREDEPVADMLSVLLCGTLTISAHKVELLP